jgi:hypothetical protein
MGIPTDAPGAATPEAISTDFETGSAERGTGNIAQHGVAGKAGSPLLEPADLGLNACCRCGYEFHGGERYRRGVARGAAGLLLYIVCARCVDAITHDETAREAFNLGLREQLAAAALAAAPVGGRA